MTNVVIGMSVQDMLCHRNGRARRHVIGMAMQDMTFHTDGRARHDECCHRDGRDDMTDAVIGMAV